MLITIMITDRIGLYKVLLQLIKTMAFNVPKKKKNSYSSVHLHRYDVLTVP